MDDLEKLAKGLANGTWTDTYKELQIIHAAHERIAELEETNQLLCRNWDEAQKVVEARDQRIKKLTDLIIVSHDGAEIVISAQPRKQDND